MNIRESSMSKSTLKKKIGQFGDDNDNDETVPLLPNLGRLSTTGKHQIPALATLTRT